MDDKYAELEKRVKILEEMLKGFLQSDGNVIHLQLENCQGDLVVGDHCDINLSNCPVGTIIPDSVEDSVTLLDDIEGRIDELNSAVDLLEDRIDAAEDRAEQLKSSFS